MVYPKLVSVTRSTRSGKKLVASFSDGTRTHFGASGYGDYTIYHADVGKREADEHKHCHTHIHFVVARHVSFHRRVTVSVNHRRVSWP